MKIYVRHLGQRTWAIVRMFAMVPRMPFAKSIGTRSFVVLIAAIVMPSRSTTWLSPSSPSPGGGCLRCVLSVQRHWYDSDTHWGRVLSSRFLENFFIGYYAEVITVHQCLRWRETAVTTEAGEHVYQSPCVQPAGKTVKCRPGTKLS